MAAYEILENDVMVHITYIESQPESNPTIAGHFREYSGIGRVLITYGIKLSIDHYCAVAPKNAEKARCDNHQQAFSCFGRNCAEPTKFTLQRWSVRACRSSPTPDAGGFESLRAHLKRGCCTRKNPSAAASCVDEGETKGISSYRFSSNCSTVMVA